MLTAEAKEDASNASRRLKEIAVPVLNPLQDGGARLKDLKMMLEHD